MDSVSIEEVKEGEFVIHGQIKSFSDYNIIKEAIDNNYRYILFIGSTDETANITLSNDDYLFDSLNNNNTLNLKSFMLAGNASKIKFNNLKVEFNITNSNISTITPTNTQDLIFSECLIHDKNTIDNKYFIFAKK